MKEFILPKKGGTVRIDILGEHDLTDALALHETTRAALPADKKRFILPQSTSYFQNLLSRQTGIMVGIRDMSEGKGLLVAQMALMGPMTLSEAIGLRIITHNDVPFHHAALTDSVVVFKSMASLPEYRGNSLASNLVLYAIDIPFTRVCNHVFTQISVGNKRSWDVFAKNKFGIVAAAYDPDDRLPRFIFQKPAFGFDFVPDIMADEVDPVADFPAIVSLTQREALVGIYEENSSEKLAFLRNREEIGIVQSVIRSTRQA